MKWARVCSHELWVTDAVAEWDAVAEDSPWEKSRMDTILRILQPGDVFYEVGAEHGWMAAIYARQVGPENVVLIEPSPDLWPNIRKVWEANFGDVLPLAAWPGFVSNCVVLLDEIELDGESGWPACSVGPETGGLAYRHLKHHSDMIPTVTIDWIVESTEPPKGMSIDVEGAELRVLEGMERTLRNDKPWVWLSVHPDLMERDFDSTPEEILAFLDSVNYLSVLLDIDHEEHWLCWPYEWGPEAWKP